MNCIKNINYTKCTVIYTVTPINFKSTQSLYLCSYMLPLMQRSQKSATDDVTCIFSKDMCMKVDIILVPNSSFCPALH